MKGNKFFKFFPQWGDGKNDQPNLKNQIEEEKKIREKAEKTLEETKIDILQKINKLLSLHFSTWNDFAGVLFKIYETHFKQLQAWKEESQEQKYKEYRGKIMDFFVNLNQCSMSPVSIEHELGYYPTGKSEHCKKAGELINLFKTTSVFMDIEKLLIALYKTMIIKNPLKEEHSNIKKNPPKEEPDYTISEIINLVSQHQDIIKKTAITPGTKETQFQEKKPSNTNTTDPLTSIGSNSDDDKEPQDPSQTQIPQFPM